MNQRLLVILCCVLLVAVGCSDPEDADEGNNSLTDAGLEDVDDEDVPGDVTDNSDTGGEEDVFAQLRRPVEVVTDSYGMRHVQAESLEDLFFMNGYVYAVDRFAQMEFFRRLATGTTAELLGGLSSEAVETDVMFRTLGLKRAAEQFVEENYDPDNEAFQALDAYCAGVNAYIELYRRGEVELPGTVGEMLPPEAIRDWEPSDVLAVGKLLAVQLTYAAPMWIEAHGVRGQILDAFPEDAADADLAARSGILADVFRMAPATDTTHIDGFPSGGTSALTMPGPHSDAKAPRIDRELIENALSLHDGISDIPGFEGLDLFSGDDFLSKGSNNWTLSGDLTATGNPNVANDPHLGLNLPTIFYPIHLELKDDIDGREPLEMMGAAILGVPGVAIGRTDKVGWGSTVGYYDYVDVYHETISGNSDDDSPATVEFDGDEVEVERVTETIRVGTFGNITDEVDLTVEIVPHHGPILPPTDGGYPVPRTSSNALSFNWVGLEASNEFEFLMRLWRAEEPSDVEEALDYYTVGSSNFVFGFTNGDIFYSGQSNIPVRAPGALTFDPVSNPEGNAPIFILPGDGSAEWTGFLDEESIPHAYNPDKGYIVTANNDQVGATLDNNPFDAEHYLGGFYDLGFRGERITERLTNATGERDADEKLTLEQQTAIQDDGFDKVAERVVPHMIDAIDMVLDDTVDDTDHPELQAVRAEVSGQETALAELRDLLDDWDYMAPATRTPSGEDVQRSAAATLFNTTMVYLLDDVYADEFREAGLYSNGRFTMPMSAQLLVRSLVHLLDEADQSQTWDETLGDSVIFDNLDTDEAETRLTHLVLPLLEARSRLASGQTLAEIWGRPIDSPASNNPEDWVWGNMHGLRLDSLFPVGQAPFRRPSTERGLPFYERPGGQFAVSPCDHGYNNFNFTCSSGSSLRMIHDMDPSGPVTYNAVPGGYALDPSSPYYDSEVEIWNRAEPRKLEDDWDTLRQDADDVTVYGE
jgi:penicillin G amidase